MASGDTLLQWSILSAEQETSAQVNFDLRNDHPVLDFDDGHIDYVYFRGILPQNYSGNGVFVYLHWTATSAVVGNCYWQTAFERIGEEVLDIDADSFAADEDAIDAAPGTCGEVAVRSSSHSSGAKMDNLLVGEHFRLRVKRNGTSGSDTMVGDAELLMIELREQ